MTKLEELREIVRLQKLQRELYEECKNRLAIMTPQGLEDYATETIRKVAELELVLDELKDKWAEWERKYDA